MAKVLAIVGIIVLALVFAFGIALLFAFPTMWLVNYLFTTVVIKSLFGISVLTFWKAFWLNFLCAALFKSANYSTDKK